jgi:hypothetical protein
MVWALAWGFFFLDGICGEDLAFRFGLGVWVNGLHTVRRDDGQAVKGGSGVTGGLKPSLRVRSFFSLSLGI